MSSARPYVASSEVGASMRTASSSTRCVTTLSGSATDAERLVEDLVHVVAVFRGVEGAGGWSQEGPVALAAGRGGR